MTKKLLCWRSSRSNGMPITVRRAALASPRAGGAWRRARARKEGRPAARVRMSCAWCLLGRARRSYAHATFFVPIPMHRWKAWRLACAALSRGAYRDVLHVECFARARPLERTCTTAGRALAFSRGALCVFECAHTHTCCVSKLRVKGRNHVECATARVTAGACAWHGLASLFLSSRPRLEKSGFSVALSGLQHAHQ